jgi:hypothetical protein
MRRLLIALAVVLLPSFAIAHGHGGGHGGMGGTGGGRMAGGWSAHAASIAGGARMRVERSHGCLERSCRQLEPLSSWPFRTSPRPSLLRRRPLVGRIRLL